MAHGDKSADETPHQLWPRAPDALYRAIEKGGASAAEPRDGGPAVTAASPRGLHARDCRSAPPLGCAKDGGHAPR